MRRSRRSWVDSLRVGLVFGLLAATAGAQGPPAADPPGTVAALDGLAPLEEVGSDADPAERLNAIFDNIGELDQVVAEVGEGVVRLTGTVASVTAREQAEEIAARHDGIVAVDNRIDISLDLARRLEPVREKLEERGLDLLAMLPLLVIALVIVAIAWRLAGWVGTWDWIFQRSSGNRFVQDLVAQVASTVVFVLGLLLALEILDATALVGAVLGTAGVVGLAVGFAFKDLVENYIASVLLSLRQPFAPGDHVVIAGHEGKVVRLSSRATVLMTLDGNHLRIPNADVFKGTVLNYSTNPRRRFRFQVGVGVEEGLERARGLALEVLGAMDGVLDDPEPLVLIDQLGDSTVSLVVFGWVDQREASFGKVRSEAIRLLKERFDEVGVSMPEPTYRLQWAGGAPTLSHPEGDGGAPPVRPPAERSGRTGDISPETHLDEEIAQERSREEDLLDADGRAE